MAEPKEIGTVWTLGCEVFVEDALTAEVQEIKVNDIVLSANIFTEGLSVEVGSDRVNAMDLDVRISMDGLKTYIIDSQIVPYEDVLKITDFSPEATNEKRYASSANTSKKIIDSVGELEGRVNLTEGDIDALGKRVDDLELKGTGGSGDGFWYLNEQDGKIHTDIGIVVHGNAIIEGDTSSGGEGQDTPAAGLDEQAILDLLEREKYVTEDDIEGLIPDVDLSEYAKTEDVKTAISEVGEEIDSLSTLLLSMWHLDDNGNLVTEKQVLIKNNLIIDGDTSSGGEGESVLVGIQGISVNGGSVVYPNSEGIVELTISGGGGTADLSNYYTKSESDNRYLASSLLGSNTLIHSGNIGSQWVDVSNSLTYRVIPSDLTTIGPKTINWCDWAQSTGQGIASYSYGIWTGSPDINYGFGLGADAFADELYFKLMRGGTVGPWRRVITTSNDGYIYGLGGYIDIQYTDEINRYGGNLYLQHRGMVAGEGTGGNYTGNVIMCDNGGNVGIGTISPSAKLHVDGQINISGGTYNNYSFIRSENYTSNQSFLRIGVCYGYSSEETAITIRYGVTSVTGDLIVSGDVASA